MNIVIWIFQGLLALMVLMTGFMKLSKLKDELKKQGGGMMDWVDDVSGGNMKLIGVAEVMGGIGLILPQILGILPWLSPLAAVGVILTMSGALTLHIRRADGVQAVITAIIIFLIAAFVAYARFVMVPA